MYHGHCCFIADTHSMLAAISLHGCIEDVDGEWIRTAAVAGGVFGGSIKYAISTPHH